MHTKLRRSSRPNKPMQRLMYDIYVAHRYAYMAKVVEAIEPTCFDEPIGNVHWKKAIHEEINALYQNETWEFVPLLKGRSLLAVSGYIR